MKDFIGEDLSRMSLTDIIKKLGIDGSKLQNDRERLVEIEKAVAAIGSADPADITPEVDLPGVNDRLEKVKEFLRTTGDKKPDVTPKIEQDSLKTAVDTAKETIQAGLTQNPVQVNLDAEKAIGQIREGLKDQIDIAIGSSEGTKHLLSIDGIVGRIETLISKIEGKLPLQALAY
jgi:ribosome-associated translation inhibitor RaiA